MKWYHYIAAFFAGAFLCNSVPHLVNGLSGDAFPTPFANPPGKGLSPAYINVAWGLFNLLIGYILYKISKISTENKIGIVLFSTGIALMGIMLSITFAGRMHY